MRVVLSKHQRGSLESGGSGQDRRLDQWRAGDATPAGPLPSSSARGAGGDHPKEGEPPKESFNIMVVGEAGLGKTTLLESFFKSFKDDDATFALFERKETQNVIEARRLLGADPLELFANSRPFLPEPRQLSAGLQAVLQHLLKLRLG